MENDKFSDSKKLRKISIVFMLQVKHFEYFKIVKVTV